MAAITVLLRIKRRLQSQLAVYEATKCSNDNNILLDSKSTAIKVDTRRNVAYEPNPPAVDTRKNIAYEPKQLL